MTSRALLIVFLLIVPLALAAGTPVGTQGDSGDMGPEAAGSRQTSMKWEDTFTDLSKVSSRSSSIKIEDGKATVGALLGFMDTDMDTVVMMHLDEGTGDVTYDSSDNGFEGDLNNMDESDWVSGVSGSALDFDGVDDHVELPASVEYDAPHVTVEAFVYQRTKVPYGSKFVVEKRGGFYLMDNTFGIDTPTVYNANYYSGLPLNKWVYIAGTFDGTTVRFFIDGTVMASTACDVPIDHDTMPLAIGAPPGNPYYVFDGIIDEVRVSNVARPPSEINDTYLAWKDGATGDIPASAFLISDEIELPTGMYWKEVSVDRVAPLGTGINISVLDGSTSDPIDGFEDLNTTTIDISTLNPKTYPSIKLLATFSSLPDTAAKLDRWSVSWRASKAPVILEVEPMTKMVRGEEGYIEINVSDPDQHPGTLYMDVKARPSSTTDWSGEHIPVISFDEKTGVWNITFATDAEAILGPYDLWVEVIDETGLTVNKTYNELLMLYPTQGTEIIIDIVERGVVIPRGGTQSFTSVILMEGGDVSKLDVQAEVLRAGAKFNWESAPQYTGGIWTFEVTVPLTAAIDDYDIRIQADDGAGQTGEQTFDDCFSVALLPPIWNYSKPFVVDSKKPETIALRDYVIDNDTPSSMITVELLDHDEWDIDIYIAKSNLHFVWIENWVESTDLVLSISDSDHMVEVTVTLRVLRTDSPPVWIEVPEDQELVPGGELWETIEAYDEDWWGAIRYAVVEGPEDMEIDTDYYYDYSTLYWEVPRDQPQGVIEVTISATSNKTINHTFKITILPPITVEITSPKDGDTVHGLITLEGTLTGPNGTRLMIEDDYGDFHEQIPGSANWSVKVDTTRMSHGKHRIYVWAYYEGSRYHEECYDQVTITVDNTKSFTPTQDDWLPYMILLPVIIAVVVIALFYMMLRK